MKTGKVAIICIVACSIFILVGCGFFVRGYELKDRTDYSVNYVNDVEIDVMPGAGWATLKVYFFTIFPIIWERHPVAKTEVFFVNFIIRPKVEGISLDLDEFVVVMQDGERIKSKHGIQNPEETNIMKKKYSGGIIRVITKKDKQCKESLLKPFTNDKNPVDIPRFDCGHYYVNLIFDTYMPLPEENFSIEMNGFYRNGQRLQIPPKKYTTEYFKKYVSFLP